MSDLKLFRIGNGSAQEIAGTSAHLEKSLQNLLEGNLEYFLGVRFLASEFSTGRVHGGRMDTLGIDENGSPVIIEFKRSSNENVINQGLFYLDWLMDHKKDFEWLVLDKFGSESAKSVDWSSPRLLCIAGDFTKYDEHAFKQINRSIELIRYRRYGHDLLLLDLVNSTTAQVSQVPYAEDLTAKPSGRTKTVTEYLEQADAELADRYESLRAFLINLGDDVTIKALKNYIAFRRIKNFACVEVHPKTRNVVVYVKVDPDSVEIEPGFTRNVKEIGHFGTGDLEITISNAEDLLRARPILERSYEAS